MAKLKAVTSLPIVCPDEGEQRYFSLIDKVDTLSIRTSIYLRRS